MAETLNYTRQIVLQTCINCGMTFGMDASVDRQFRNTHELFYCPKGHQQFYSGENEAERLRKQLAEKDRSIQLSENRINRLHDQLTTEKSKTRAEKAAKTRIKNRIAHGVCPCCNRTFKQLAEHMKTQHPEYRVS